MVDTYLKGGKPEVNDYQEYDNGKKIIGTYICEGQLINEGNYESLIDNGYFEEEEILPQTEEDSVETDIQEADEQEEKDSDQDSQEAEDPNKKIPEDSILSILGDSRKDL